MTKAANLENLNVESSDDYWGDLDTKPKISLHETRINSPN